MAWRFKASKYKNAAPIVPKFEQHIRDLVSISNKYCSEQGTSIYLEGI